MADARRAEVLLAYGMNGQPLPVQHGAPCRLIVPGWYGMASVKWLSAVTAGAAPFGGYQMTSSYVLRASAEDAGRPVTRILPRALMLPPGIPDFLTRARHLPPGPVVLEGRAWSGHGSVVRVAVSTDGGALWADATLEEPAGPFAWLRWTYRWEPPGPGEYELACQATDSAGNSQPTEAHWNWGGYENNAIQVTRVTVGET